MADRGRVGRLFHTLTRTEARQHEGVCPRVLSLERVASSPSVHHRTRRRALRSVRAPRRDRSPQRALDAGEHRRSDDRSRREQPRIALPRMSRARTSNKPRHGGGPHVRRRRKSCRAFGVHVLNEERKQNAQAPGRQLTRRNKRDTPSLPSPSPPSSRSAGEEMRGRVGQERKASEIFSEAPRFPPALPSPPVEGAGVRILEPFSTLVYNPPGAHIRGV